MELSHVVIHRGELPKPKYLLYDHVVDCSASLGTYNQECRRMYVFQQLIRLTIQNRRSWYCLMHLVVYFLVWGLDVWCSFYANSLCPSRFRWNRQMPHSLLTFFSFWDRRRDCHFTHIPKPNYYLEWYQIHILSVLKTMI